MGLRIDFHLSKSHDFVNRFRRDQESPRVVHQYDLVKELKMARTVLLLFIATSLVGCTGSSIPQMQVSSPQTSKATFPLQGNLDLGVVEQGRSVELRKWIRNDTDSAIQIAEAKSSCECLTVQFSQKQVDAKSKVLIHLHYDGAKEPHFTGSLLIEVEITDDQKKKIGQIDVPIEVVQAEILGEAHR